MAKTSQGQGIRCSSCGAAFPLTTLAAAIACPYCGARQELRGGSFEDVRQYRADVFSEMHAADAETRQADAWSAWRGQAGMPTMMLGIVLLVMVGPMCLSLPVYLLHLGHLQIPPAIEGILGVLGSFCTIGVVIAAIGGAAYMQSRRNAQRANPRAANRETKVACPHCGARSRLSAGQAVQTCEHCRGALMPSKTIMVQALDGVRLVKRRAMLTRYAAEREGMLGVQTYTRRYARIMPLFFIIPMAPMLLGVCAVPFSALSEGSSLATALLVLVPILLLVGAAAAVGAFFLMRAHQRRQAFRRSLDDLAMQFHGRASLALDDFVRWLNTSWAGPYDLNFVCAGSGFGTVTVDAWGYSAAVAINPKRQAYPQGNYPIYVRIAVAAWIPSRSDGGPPPPLDPRALQTMAWLQSAGFAVSCEEGGLLATAHPHVVEQLRESPEAAHQLAPVLGHLARLAHEVGARPVGPS